MLKKLVTLIGWLTIILIIAVGVFAYLFFNSPETIPAGIGVFALPVEISERSSRVFMGRVIIITNTSDKTLHNLTITCEGTEPLVIEEASLKPNARISLGWRQGIDWNEHPSITISASGYTTHSHQVGE